MKQKQSLPLEAKIKLAQNRIREWYDHWEGMVFLSFSGGKDSTVLRDIIKKMYPDIPIVFVDTGLEYPEIRQFAINNSDKVLHPEITFNKVITEFGYPIVSKEVAECIEDARRNLPLGKETTRIQQLMGTYKDKNGKLSAYNKSKWKFLIDEPFKISNKCCDYMKKKPISKYEKESGRCVIVGTMACESRLRTMGYLKTGCNSFNGKRPMSRPLSVWTEQDILQYLYESKIEYAKIYGEIKKDADGDYYTTGVNRTGCIFCGFGCHLEKEPNRFQMLKKSHPKLYNYCIGGGNTIMVYGNQIRRGWE